MAKRQKAADAAFVIHQHFIFQHSLKELNLVISCCYITFNILKMHISLFSTFFMRQTLC